MNKAFDLEAAIPTYAHMALATLLQNGALKHIVSTNLDGLHMRSGVKEPDLSELHGNCYKEKCNVCGTVYLRGFDVSKQPRRDHITGRNCEKEGCQGQLCTSRYKKDI
jgi:NAD-dependent SIR2 family protein deacetylase